MATHNSGDIDDESERKIAIQNKKEIYEIFAKNKKYDMSQIIYKINDKRKLDKLLIMVEQMAKDMKLLWEEQHECKKEINKPWKENEGVKKGMNKQFKVDNENIRKDMQNLQRIVKYIEKVNKQNNVIVSGMRMNDQEHGSMKGTLEDLFKK